MMKSLLTLPLALITGLAAVSLANEAEPAAASGIPTDDQITRSIEKTLRYDPRVHSADLEVSTEEGIVTLTGFVENLPMKRFAIELTETRAGVRSIVDRLEILPEKRDDALIQHQVDQALATGNATLGSGITATVNDGVVRLHGVVGSFAMSDLAERNVESVRGVRGVVNELHVKPDETRGDEEIRQHLRIALRDDPWIEAGLVVAEVKDGVVTLSGMLDSLAEKRRLREAVSVPGVTGIEEERLVVTAGLQRPSERQAPPEQRPDEEIESSLIAAIQADPRVRSDRLEIHVEGGVASLKGQVGSLGARQAAVADARNTPGVSQVYDYVEISPRESIDDDVLAEALQLAVDADVHLVGADIEVDVSDGRVVLNGAAETEYQWAHAGQLAARATGVREIENRLRILWPMPEAYLDLISEARMEKRVEDAE